MYVLSHTCTFPLCKHTSIGEHAASVWQRIYQCRTHMRVSTNAAEIGFCAQTPSAAMSTSSSPCSSSRCDEEFAIDTSGRLPWLSPIGLSSCDNYALRRPTGFGVTSALTGPWSFYFHPGAGCNRQERACWPDQQSGERLCDFVPPMVSSP